MRLFAVTGTCNIPPTATSLSASIAVVNPAGSGFLRVFPGDVAEPQTNTVIFSAGQTRAGNGMFLLATDGSGTLAFRNLSSGVVDVVFDVTGYFDTGCPPITVTPPSLPDLADGTPYNAVLTPSGGRGPYFFAVTSGALPGGIALSAAGILSGTATAAGSFSFTATATDSNNCTGFQAYTLFVACPAITVSPTTIPPIAVGVPYGPVTFTQTGSVGGVTWSFTGTLPTGVTLSATGVLAGTPTQGGSFPITVTATDAGGCSGSVNVGFSTCPSISVTNPATATATAGTPFSQTFAQGGGALPVSFSLASGTLPAGLSLSAGGVLAGTPTQTGTFPITVKVTDGNGCTGGGATYTLSIAPSIATQNYSGVGNTQFYVTGVAGAPTTPAVSTAFGLLTSAQPAGSVTVTAASCTVGAAITTFDAAGRFLYTPNLGATSSTCSYTVSSDSGATGTPVVATASLNVSLTGMVWYVNNAGGADSGSRGRSHEPLLTIGQAVTNASANQTIFLHTGSSAYAGASLSKAGMTLWGQGTTFTLSSLTIAAGAKPTLNSTLTMAANTLTVSSLDIASTTTTGFTNAGATGGSTVQNGVAVTTTTGTAVSLNNAGGTFTFQAISADGGSRGIFLTNTTGSFTVTGNAGNCTPVDTTCSGGTLQNMAGPDDSTASPPGTAIVLNNAQNVSLTRMRIRGNSNYGIRGTGVNGFTFDSGLMDGVNGTNDAAPFNEGGAYFSNLTGSATVSSSNLSGGFADNFRVINAGGTLNRITFAGVTIGANSTTNGHDGITLEAQGAAVINATVQASTFTSARGDLFQLNNIGTASCDLVFTGNALSNNHPAIATGGGGVTIGGGDNGGSLTFNVSTNTFRDAVGHAVLIAKSTGAGSYTGTFDGNTIGVPGLPDSGSFSGDGLKLQNAGLGTVSASITNNQIFQYNNFGIDLLTGGSATPQSGQLTATITGNTVGSPGAQGFPAGNGIMLNVGTVVGDTYQVCLTLGGGGPLANSLAGSALGAGTDFRLRQRQSTQVKLLGYAGGSTDDAAVVSFVQSNNSGNGTPTGAASHTTGFLGGVSCP